MRADMREHVQVGPLRGRMHEITIALNVLACPIFFVVDGGHHIW